MVCLGNICRSPLAEGILQNKLKEKYLNIQVESAGTENYHVGQNPDNRAIAIGKKYGIDISKHIGTQFKPNLYDKYDIIYVMDSTIYNEIISQARNNEDKKKVEYILNVVEKGKNKPVPDPYYGGNEGFELVYKLLDEACEIIVEYLSKNKY